MKLTRDPLLTPTEVRSERRMPATTAQFSTRLGIGGREVRCCGNRHLWCMDRPPKRHFSNEPGDSEGKDGEGNRPQKHRVQGGVDGLDVASVHRRRELGQRGRAGSSCPDES